MNDYVTRLDGGDTTALDTLPLGRNTGLERVAAAEEVVAGLGFSQYRVRFHGDLARIEVPSAEIARLADEEFREELLAGVRDAGFRFVTIDLSGYARGSSNPLAMADE